MRFVVALAFILLSVSAAAQQPPVTESSVYLQLLQEANTRLAKAMTESAALQARVKALEDEKASAKRDNAP